MDRILRTSATLVFSLLFTSLAAYADVTITRTASMDGMGGLLKSSSTSTESYSGDKMTNDGETKMENKMLKLFGGGKPIRTTSITRLDSEVMWNLDHKEKTYTEMTFAQMRALMDSAGTMLAGQPDPMAQQKPSIDTSEITFAPPKFEIKRTGKREVIAGHDSEESILTMLTEGTHRETGEKMTLDLKLEMMLAQDVPGADEAAAFGKRMATAMGFEMDKGMAKSMMSMLSMYGVDPDEIAEQAEKLEGFAMKTTMSFAVGGDAIAKAEAEAARAKEEQDAKDREEAAQKEEDPPSTDAASIAAKALGGLFGKKDKKQDEDESSNEANSSASAGSLFWMTTTVTGIDASGVPATTFEIPVGYKLDRPEYE